MNAVNFIMVFVATMLTIIVEIVQVAKLVRIWWRKLHVWWRKCRAKGGARSK